MSAFIILSCSCWLDFSRRQCETVVSAHCCTHDRFRSFFLLKHRKWNEFVGDYFKRRMNPCLEHCESSEADLSRDQRHNLKSVKFSPWTPTSLASPPPPARPLENFHLLAPRCLFVGRVCFHSGTAPSVLTIQCESLHRLQPLPPFSCWESQQKTETSALHLHVQTRVINLISSREVLLKLPKSQTWYPDKILLHYMRL